MFNNLEYDFNDINSPRLCEWEILEEMEEDDQSYNEFKKKNLRNDFKE